MLVSKLKSVAPALLVFGVLAAGLSARQPDPPPARPPRPVAAPPATATGPDRIVFRQNGKILGIDPDGKNEKEVFPGLDAGFISSFTLSRDGRRFAGGD